MVQVVPRVGKVASILKFVPTARVGKRLLKHTVTPLPSDPNTINESRTNDGTTIKVMRETE